MYIYIRLLNGLDSVESKEANTVLSSLPFQTHYILLLLSVLEKYLRQISKLSGLFEVWIMSLIVMYKPSLEIQWKLLPTPYLMPVSGSEITQGWGEGGGWADGSIFTAFSTSLFHSSTATNGVACGLS